MDFFAQQDQARRKTSLLLFNFFMAVAATILMIYFLPVLGWYLFQSGNASPAVQEQLTWWYPSLFIGICTTTLIIVFGGSLYKIVQLHRSGGAGITEMLGGKQIAPGSNDYFERRLHNVVEEMAIASGVPVPAVYVLPNEPGINAFAAGLNLSDAVIAVTYGTMTGLKRDELMGVIAHEFSHILNRDMRMNINLMGIIHGLIVIGLTGRLLIEILLRSRRGGGRQSKNSGQALLLIIAAGILLWIVGSCGMFFAKWIKAAISRSRERLADASAVQFTRNPAGLASALKKIGGLTAGSRLLTPNAPQASHMFFGSGVRTSIFSTHPSLVERVRWLEPTFDGTFPSVTSHSLREQLTQFENAPAEKGKNKPDVVDIFTKPHKTAITVAALETAAAASAPQFHSNNPEELISSIGSSLEQHVETARALLDAIPEPVKTAARDPHGARMLMYYLLLDADATIRSKQLATIKQLADPEVITALSKAQQEIGKLPPELRLPIIDLSIPALRFLSPTQYKTFRAILTQLVAADQQTDIFEYALQRVLLTHLDPAFSGATKPRAANYYAIKGLPQETSIILSVLARKGHETESMALEAFNAAIEKIPESKTKFQFLPEADCHWENLDTALEKFSEASFKVKKWLLGAALACLVHDGEITIEEVELFRAVADALGCPVPPWVTPLNIS